MTEITIRIDIPEEFKEEIEESDIDLSSLVKELIISKVFEIHLSKSKALQKALLEALIKKSKLNEKDANELTDKINRGMLKEIKEEFPEL